MIIDDFGDLNSEISIGRMNVYPCSTMPIFNCCIFDYIFDDLDEVWQWMELPTARLHKCLHNMMAYAWLQSLNHGGHMKLYKYVYIGPGQTIANHTHIFTLYVVWTIYSGTLDYIMCVFIFH